MPLSRLYLTCPIFYVNAPPHLGHAYTLCLADAWARYACIRGSPTLAPFSWQIIFKRQQKPSAATFLSAGTDEHGLKVKQSALRVGQEPQQYCDSISPLFKSLCKHNSVVLDDFVRTTEERHRMAVNEIWRRLDCGDHLYESLYKGWYSVSDEMFYAEREVTETKPATTTHGPLGLTESGTQVEWVEESNVLFRLQPFKDRIHNWLDSGVFLPSHSQQFWVEKSHALVESTNDVSVSRPRQRLEWGIGVPNRPDQVIYVWLDALSNYLTVAGFPDELNKSPKFAPWPPDYQFFGMDILRFHVVLWPALLMALDLPLPRHLICHHHILADGVKMSKSRGNVVDPFLERVALTPDGDSAPIADSEGLRYVLLRSALLSQDASYTRTAAKNTINTDLVNCLGNLLSRVTSVNLNPHQSIVCINREEAGAMFQQFKEDEEFFDSLDSLPRSFDRYWWELAQPHLAIEQVLDVLRQTNALVDRYQPWSKTPIVEPELVIAVAAESLRMAGLLFSPVIPNLSRRLLHRLGFERDEQSSEKELQYDRLFQRLGSDNKPLLRRLP